MSIVNTITDLKDKVMEWVKSYAAPKTHVNQKASSNTLGHVMVDAGLNQNSINPVQNATIKSELDNKANKTDLLKINENIKGFTSTTEELKNAIGNPTYIKIYRTKSAPYEFTREPQRLVLNSASPHYDDYRQIIVDVYNEDGSLLTPQNFNDTPNFFWYINGVFYVTTMAMDGHTKLDIRLNGRKDDWEYVSTDKYQPKENAGYPLLVFFEETNNPIYKHSYKFKRLLLAPNLRSDGTISEKDYQTCI